MLAPGKFVKVGNNRYLVKKEEKSEPEIKISVIVFVELKRQVLKIIILNVTQYLYLIEKVIIEAKTEFKCRKKSKKKTINFSIFSSQVFSAEDHKTMSIFDKSDLYFYDYNLAGLFVQENYLSVTPQVTFRAGRENYLSVTPQVTFRVGQDN